MLSKTNCFCLSSSEKVSLWIFYFIYFFLSFKRRQFSQSIAYQNVFSANELESPRTDLRENTSPKLSVETSDQVSRRHRHLKVAAGCLIGFCGNFLHLIMCLQKNMHVTKGIKSHQSILDKPPFVSISRNQSCLWG